MIFPRLLTALLFSLLIACGQQGPLFMPIEDTKTQYGDAL